MRLATAVLDDLDKRLLTRLQQSFPLVPRPLAELGAELGAAEGEILARTRRLKQERVLRQISGLFDSRRLGYLSSLVGVKVLPEECDRVGEATSGHPGVSHSYRRAHAYNLWFTLTVRRGQSLEEEVRTLTERPGVQAVHLFPTHRLFKIGVRLDLTDKRDPLRREAVEGFGDPGREVPEDAETVSPATLTPADQRIVRALQEDLPVTEEPYREAARRAGIEEAELLRRGRELLQEGVLRRIAGVLYHRDAGFAANAMGVWNVPEERVKEVGPVLASFAAVSHCYQRPTYDDWPYPLFTMIHARSDEECLAIARQMAVDSGMESYELLFTVKEYKKSRVRYLVEEV